MVTMRRFQIAVLVLVSLGLVAAMLLVVVVWCYLNHRRSNFGPLLISISPTHGIHADDLLFLGVELVLGLLLTGVLIVGFSGGDSR